MNEQQATGQHLYHAVPQPGNSKAAKTRRLVIAASATLLVLVGGGYVFGYYLPNRPQNVLNAALNNTGDGYDRMIGYFSNDKVSQKFQNTEVAGTYKVEGSGLSTDGSVSAHFDGQNARFSGDVGLGITRLKLEGLAKDVKGSNAPDLYLKASGIKGLGSLYGMPAADSLDNQWIVVDHTLFDSISKQVGQTRGMNPSQSMKSPQKDDVVAAAKVMGNVADKYLFTTSNSTAVVSMDSFVGKEVVDGKQTNHYKVKANKANLKAFSKELGQELDKTALSKWTRQTYGRSLSEIVNTKYIAKSADGVKETDRFDIWVNTNTKLVHKMRFSDRNDAAHNYMELGLNYDGGPQMPLFVTIADNKDGVEGKGTIGFTLNTDTNVVKLTVDGRDRPKGGAGDTTVKADLTFKPSNGKVDVSVPAGTIPLSEALSRVGFGDYLQLLTGSLSQVDSFKAEASNPFTISL